MINRTVTTEGGEYIKTLERPVRATHLLCASTIEGEVTEKMKYAEKFNKAGEARIKIIWEEWLWDCLTLGGVHLFLLRPIFDKCLRVRFQGRLDEEPYRITNPPRPRLILPQGTMQCVSCIEFILT